MTETTLDGLNVLQRKRCQGRKGLCYYIVWLESESASTVRVNMLTFTLHKNYSYNALT